MSSGKKVTNEELNDPEP